MEEILREQLDYYQKRAREYDKSVGGTGYVGAVSPENDEVNQEWLYIHKALHAIGPVGDALELACGTGIWTRELLLHSNSITAVDGSPEMIIINREKLGDTKIKYQCLDIFEWEPDKTYDLVFFAFWLSHVPPSHLSGFLDKVARATKPGGRVFIIDEPKSDKNISGANVDGLYQQRSLDNGSSYRIVKVYYDPMEIELAFLEKGFFKESITVGKSFFSLCTSKFYFEG